MLNKSEINFKVKEIRTIKSPSGKDITSYIVMVNFHNLPSNLSLDANPRKPKMTTNVAKAIIKAVESTDDNLFDINNRGIVITAKSFRFNSNNSTVTIDMGNDTGKYGILDGGHTYKAIIEHRENYFHNIEQLEEDSNREFDPRSLEKFVKLEIIVGSDVDIVSLANARNTSTQVSDIALYNLDDQFDFIKEAISNEKYANKVAYKDFDIDKSINISDILRLMFMMNIKRFPNEDSVPVQAYSAKASVFKDFKKEIDANSNNIYTKLAPMIPQFISLYEKIDKTLPDKYQEYKNKENQNSKFGGLRGVTTGNFHTLYSESSKNYDISIGYIYPIFGAFRALLQEENNKLVWKNDPFKLWEKVGYQLVQNTVEADKTPQAIGKKKNLWQSNYRIIDSAEKDLELDELKRKLNEKNQ